MGSDCCANLHVHTEFSLLDGACRIDQLVERVKNLGQEHIGITDHGVLTGTLSLQKAADKAGIKPIPGIELYFTDDRNVRDPKNRYYHLTALAETDQGLINLAKMNYWAGKEGMYHRKPRVDWELLERFGEGVIILSGCMQSPFSQALLNVERQPDRRQREHDARDVLMRLGDCVGRENVYIEVQNSGASAHGSNEWEWNEQKERIGQDLGIMRVGTADTHYLTADLAAGPKVGDPWHHDTLLCVQTKKPKGLPLDKRMSLIHDWDRPQYYHLKTAAELRKDLENVPGSVENSLLVADRCNARWRTGRTFEMLPNFPVPEDYQPTEKYTLGMEEVMFRQESYLRQQVLEGLHRRYGAVIPAEARKRSEYEVDVIISMGTTSYFLIIADVVRFAKSIGIVVGPGRGSGAGSLVLYALDVTQLDPLVHGLMFERFLNPERVSMPDVDIDFSHGFDQLRAYISGKYGEENCAQIITFGTLGSKSGVKAAARAFGPDFRQLGDQLSGAVSMKGQTPANLSECLDDPDGQHFSRELSSMVQSNDDAARLVESARWMEGLIQNEGVHAAAYVVSPFPLTDALPVQFSKDDQPVTAFSMSEAEEVGCLKIDLLGLRNLIVLSETQRLVKKYQGIDIHAVDWQLPLDDARTYEMLALGDAIGVFQFESEGMRDTLRTIGVTEFEDLVAIVAAYRPGAMGQIPKYARRKKGLEPVTYGDSRMEEVLSETYGLVFYQEQSMKLSQLLAGFTGGLMDTLRKAIGKKNMALMQELKPKFYDGCVVTDPKTGEEIKVPGALANGVNRKTVDEIWNVFEASADYSFNKSHAAAYALISVATAYLKANFPVEFMAALLTSVIGKKDKNKEDKVPFYLYEAKRMGLRILPPSVNDSFNEFEPAGDDVIRFGLTAIKEVGDGTVTAIVEERESSGPFKSFWDFCRRVTTANAAEVKAMIQAGAFDWTDHKRPGLMEVTDECLKRAKSIAKKESKGQISLFSIHESTEAALDTLASFDEPNVPDLWWDDDEKFRRERLVTGLYVSGHPLDADLEAWRRVATTGVTQVGPEMISGDKDNPTVITLAGIITSKRVLYTKKHGERMCTFTLEDVMGQAEIVAFPKSVKAGIEEHIEPGRKVWVRVAVQEDKSGFGRSEDDDNIQIQFVAQVAGEFSAQHTPDAQQFTVTLDAQQITERRMSRIIDVLRCHPGATPVRVVVRNASNDGGPIVFAHETVQVSTGQALEDALAAAI